MPKLRRRLQSAGIGGVLSVACLFVATVGLGIVFAAPTVATPSASPSFVIVNTRTTVIVTVAIPDPLLIPQSVNLIRISGGLLPVAVLGQMRDDGTNGDVTSGDKIFSLSISVLESNPSEQAFAVSAAFRGLLKRVLSPPVIVRAESTIQAAAIIGTAGGVVEITDPASAIFGARVSIPSGALPSDTTISIATAPAQTLPVNNVASGPVVDFLPSGITFNAPVQLTLPVTNTDDPSNAIYLIADDGSVIVETSTLADEDTEHSGQFSNDDGSRMYVLADHFSARQVLGRTDIRDALRDAAPATTVPLPIPLADCTRCTLRLPTDIDHIVVHSTNNPENQSFAGLLSWIHSTIGAGTGKGGEAFFAQYYIDQAGHVVQLVDDSVVTAHVGQVTGENGRSLGIELFDGEGTGGYTAEQLAALDTLTKDLMGKYDIQEDGLLRHKDLAVGDTDHQDPYQMSDDDWNDFKKRAAPPTVTKTLTLSVAGPGTIRLSSSGAACVGPQTCIFEFKTPGIVQLQVEPNATSEFSGWAGSCSGKGDCAIDVSTSLQATATFTPGCVKCQFAGSFTAQSHQGFGWTNTHTIDATVSLASPAFTFLILTMNVVQISDNPNNPFPYHYGPTSCGIRLTVTGSKVAGKQFPCETANQEGIFEGTIRVNENGLKMIVGTFRLHNLFVDPWTSPGYAEDTGFVAVTLR